MSLIENTMNVVCYSINVNLHSMYRIALVTDLHGRSGEEILSILYSNKPDIIAIAGDLVDTSIITNTEILKFLKKCTNIGFTVFSLGNHDYHINNDDFAVIEDCGVQLLNDTWVSLNSEIVIGGLTSSFYYKCEHFDPKLPMELHPETDWLKEFEEQKGFKILLDHHPENYDKYTKNRDIDLILSGHNHGGQIRLFGKGVYARNQGLFPKYDGGIYENRLVVSRGLSNTLPIPRLWNPRELVFVTLERV